MSPWPSAGRRAGKMTHVLDSSSRLNGPVIGAVGTIDGVDLRDMRLSERGGDRRRDGVGHES